MTQTLQAALGTLEQSSARAGATQDLSDHLSDARSLLEGELGWVEEALSEASKGGPSPGSDAARHLVELGGKRVRPVAVLLSAGCFGPISSAARELAVCVELIHSATLLHDDVIDEGTERRGQAASRVVWGNAVSVLGGDLLLTHALTRAQEHIPELMTEFLTTLRHLVVGEIVQLRGRTEVEVSEAVYEAILRDKTAALFRFATAAGARLGGASEVEQGRLGRFGDCLGMAFQLVDDLLDYTGSATGKTMFADLRQGKLTLPLVLAAGRQPQLLEQLKQIRAGDDGEVAALRRRVIDSGVCSAVAQRALGYTESAIRELDGVPETPARQLLQGVATQLAARTR